MNKILVTLALTLALAFPATAAHCTAYDTASPEVDAAGMYYVDYDPCYANGGALWPLLDQVLGIVPKECIFSIWLYEESNGIAGLQRGDEVVDNTCHGSIPSDTIVF